MIRLANLNAALITLTIVMAFGNYHVAGRAERAAKRIAALDSEIAKQEEALRTLEAEWSYLNNPNRLQALALRHLQLAQIKSTQVISMKALPDKLPLPVKNQDNPPSSPGPSHAVQEGVILPVRATGLPRLGGN